MSGNGGPAFPRPLGTDGVGNSSWDQPGMSLRDWFAGVMQADDRLVKCVRAMDDRALEAFALYPDMERDEHITDTDLALTDWSGLSREVAKVARRLELEARAIARVRYMQSDALLAERDKQGAS